MDGWNEAYEGAPNVKKEGHGFFISFNPSENHPFGSMAPPDTSIGETAIVHEGSFFILNGDFRNEYDKLIPKGIRTCMEFYEANKDKRSTWSD